MVRVCVARVSVLREDLYDRDRLTKSEVHFGLASRLQVKCVSLGLLSSRV